eukprot:4213694-Alexandrium_andersonii.AAC.1
MSASLVGSEMCIRDRKLGDSALRRFRAVGEGRSARSACWGHGLLWLGSVSYTHLTLPTICSV